VPPRYAFDSDVLIYAATASNPHGGVIRNLLQHAPPQHHLGSVLLYPELLSKPSRLGHTDELRTLQGYLARLHLADITADIALLATQFSAAYRLKAADALHLASAVHAGADAFVTNNRKDFRPGEVLEIKILSPDGVG
jgi:predicted nucleic acid-binding protein